MPDLQSLMPSDLIGTQLTISLTTTPEHRELTGTLLALDNKPNLLLQNVMEITKDPKNCNTILRRRELGLVSVPAEHIGSVRVVTRELEKIIHGSSLIV